LSAPFGKLLLVDDEKPVLDVLVEYFTTQGHEIETAGDGPSALAAFARVHPDLVLLDIRMPGMDGVEVLKRIRALASTPVIMVTANEDVALARLTLRLGAFDYVSKPFDFTYLDRAVTTALLHATQPAAPALASPEGERDPRRALAFALFRVTRAMSPPARGSTGARLEDLALAFAIDARPSVRQLDHIELLLDLAVDLGDLGSAERRALAPCLEAARRALASR
jgi:DNA-binding response OmpR family regulator